MSIETVKKLIQEPHHQKQLSMNDLKTFYSDIVFEIAVAKDGCKEDVGKLTTFLESCGIDTINALKKVPMLYCACVTPPDSILKFNNLKFPSHIKEIGAEAFYSSPGFTTLDLRGIETVGPMAFFNTQITEVLINESLKNADRSIFRECKIEWVYLPDNADFEVLSELIRYAFDWDYGVPNFERYN